MSAAAVSPAVSEQQAGKHETEDEEARWRPVLPLPCQLTVDLSLPHFTVGNFLALRPGSIVETHWGLAHDVPLRVNGTLVGWGELEGAGNRLAVRLTELA